MTAPRFSLNRGDAVAWLRTLADESVDLLVTDPAYESLEKHRKVGTTTRLKQSDASSNPWFQIFPNSRFPEFFVEVFRVLRPNSHFYILCDQETMFITKPMAEAVGFTFWKPIVWDKVFLGMGYHFRARYEFVLFFEKGKRKLNDLGVPDVLSFKRIRGGYPTEKPVELLEVLVKQSSSLGQLVVDPFMGSGSTGEAAVKLGRNFAGNDLDAEAVARTAIRMRPHGAELALDVAQLVTQGALAFDGVSSPDVDNEEPEHEGDEATDA